MTELQIPPAAIDDKDSFEILECGLPLMSSM
jgi:hypothetical protein